VPAVGEGEMGCNGMDIGNRGRGLHPFGFALLGVDQRCALSSPHFGMAMEAVLCCAVSRPDPRGMLRSYRSRSCGGT
jgi:hypothetical protein